MKLVNKILTAYVISLSISYGIFIYNEIQFSLNLTEFNYENTTLYVFFNIIFKFEVRKMIEKYLLYLSQIIIHLCLKIFNSELRFQKYYKVTDIFLNQKFNNKLKNAYRSYFSATKRYIIYVTGKKYKIHRISSRFYYCTKLSSCMANSTNLSGTYPLFSFN